MLNKEPRAVNLRMPKYTVIDGPFDDASFGIFPELKGRGYHYCKAPIYLYYGEHKGTHHGFGLYHIWEQRLRTEFKLSMKTAIPFLVREIKIVLSKASIHCEFEHPGGKHRAVVIAHSTSNTVVMQYLDRRQVYSIVTWFSRNISKPNKPRIGNIAIEYGT